MGNKPAPRDQIDKDVRLKRVEVVTVKDRPTVNYHNLEGIKDEIVLMDNRTHRFYYGIIPYDPPHCRCS